MRHAPTGRRCVATLQSCGLKVLGDCVLNHRCASQQDSQGVWNQYGGRMDWDARAIVRDDTNFGGRGACAVHASAVQYRIHRALQR